mgnify:CR=1 FL=1
MPKAKNAKQSFAVLRFDDDLSAGSISAKHGLACNDGSNQVFCVGVIWIADDLINSDDRRAAGSVTDDAGLTAGVVCFSGGGCCETKNSGGSDEGEDGFHMCVWKNCFRTLRRGRHEAIQSP